MYWRDSHVFFLPPSRGILRRKIILCPIIGSFLPLAMVPPSFASLFAGLSCGARVCSSPSALPPVSPHRMFCCGSRASGGSRRRESLLCPNKLCVSQDTSQELRGCWWVLEEGVLLRVYPRRSPRHRGEVFNSLLRQRRRPLAKGRGGCWGAVGSGCFPPFAHFLPLVPGVSGFSCCPGRAVHPTGCAVQLETGRSDRQPEL